MSGIGQKAIIIGKFWKYDPHLYHYIYTVLVSYHFPHLPASETAQTPHIARRRLLITTCFDLPDVAPMVPYVTPSAPLPAST